MSVAGCRCCNARSHNSTRFCPRVDEMCYSKQGNLDLEHFISGSLMLLRGLEVFEARCGQPLAFVCPPHPHSMRLKMSRHGLYSRESGF